MLLEKWPKLEREILYTAMDTFSERQRHRLQKIAKLPNLTQKIGKRLSSLDIGVIARATTLHENTEAKEDVNRFKTVMEILNSHRTLQTKR